MKSFIKILMLFILVSVFGVYSSQDYAQAAGKKGRGKMAPEDSSHMMQEKGKMAPEDSSHMMQEKGKMAPEDSSHMMQEKSKMAPESSSR